MQAAKIDANQTEIVEALRQVGCSVEITSRLGKGYPDLTVGYRGVTYLIEVKTDKGKLTTDQIRWQARWRGHVKVVRSVNEALATVGAI